MIILFESYDNLMIILFESYDNLMITLFECIGVICHKE
jgi:hypothetical protein